MLIHFGGDGEAPKVRRRRGEGRRAHDAYMTPMPLVEVIVDRVAGLFSDDAMPKIIEPSCGDGEFVSACHRMWPESTIAAIDIRAEVQAKIDAFCYRNVKFIHSDFLQTPSAIGADLIIGNPPY